jgi:hypothetical protein
VGHLRVALVCAIVIGAVSLPVLAAAQTSFDSLVASGRLEEGDAVAITEVNGRRFNARVESLTPSALIVTSDRGRWTFAPDQLSSVRTRDPLWNGTLIGLGIGFGVAVVTTRAMCGSNDSECAAIVNLVLGIPSVAGGAAVGALVDALRRETVYRGPAGSRGGALRIAPMLSRDRQGIRLSVTF